MFIDEVLELPKVYQTALYLALDRHKLSVCGTKSVQSIPLANFTLILGTTDEYSVLQPLRDRMKLVLRFDFYSAEELAQIVRLRAKALEWELEEGLLGLRAANGDRAGGDETPTEEIIRRQQRVARRVAVARLGRCNRHPSRGGSKETLPQRSGERGRG